MTRIKSLDLARGFTVLLMPSIHVVMMYSNVHVQGSLLGIMLAFIAEGPGAQLFMLIMGISFSLSSNLSWSAVLKRTLWFFIAGFILNYLKFIIPLKAGFLPPELVAEVTASSPQNSPVQSFLQLGDILYFAAITYPLTYFIFRQKYYPYLSLILAILITILSPLCWDIQTGIQVIDFFLPYLNGHPPACFFPVFPWLVYPLTGLALGNFLTKFNAVNTLIKSGWIGFGLILLSLTMPATLKINPWPDFYRTGPADTLFHVGIVLLTLSFFRWVSVITGPNMFFQLLTFCSKNITTIYFLQWLLICWGFYFTAYQSLNFYATLRMMIIVTASTLILTKLLNKYEIN